MAKIFKNFISTVWATRRHVQRHRFFFLRATISPDLSRESHIPFLSSPTCLGPPGSWAPWREILWIVSPSCVCSHSSPAWTPHESVDRIVWWKLKEFHKSIRKHLKWSSSAVLPYRQSGSFRVCKCVCPWSAQDCAVRSYSSFSPRPFASTPPPSVLNEITLSSTSCSFFKVLM